MSDRDKLAEEYAHPNWPKKSEWDRPERYKTLMYYEVGYIVEEAFADGFDAGERSPRVMALVKALRRISKACATPNTWEELLAQVETLSADALKQWEGGEK